MHGLSTSRGAHVLAQLCRVSGGTLGRRGRVCDAMGWSRRASREGQQGSPFQHRTVTQAETAGTKGLGFPPLFLICFVRQSPIFFASCSTSPPHQRGVVFIVTTPRGRAQLMRPLLPLLPGALRCCLANSCWSARLLDGRAPGDVRRCLLLHLPRRLHHGLSETSPL